jgi:hypothetical protein
VGAALAFVVAQLQGKYYLEIILPGSLLGIIVGYATQPQVRTADSPGPRSQRRISAGTSGTGIRESQGVSWTI